MEKVVGAERDNAVDNKKSSDKRPIARPVLAILTVAIIIAALFVFLKPGSKLDSITRLTGQVFRGAVDQQQGKQTAIETEIETEGPERQAQGDEQKRLDEAKRLEEARELLMVEAKSQNIEVNDSAANDLIRSNLEIYQISEEDFVQYLERNGLTYDQYKEELKSQLAIAELVNKNVDLKGVNVSEKEVDDFIEENKGSFQELLGNEVDAEALRSKVKYKLLQDKQTELVMDYVDSLK